MSRPSLIDGRPDLTILVSYQPARAEGDEVIGISIAVVDMTDRKRAEELVRTVNIHLPPIVAVALN